MNSRAFWFIIWAICTALCAIWALSLLENLPPPSEKSLGLARAERAKVVEYETSASDDRYRRSILDEEITPSTASPEAIERVEVIDANVLPALTLPVGEASVRTSEIVLAENDPLKVWVRAYSAAEVGAELEAKGRLDEARQKYEESASWYELLQREFPDYQPEDVRENRTKVLNTLDQL